MRERDAGTYINYGCTRPGVISQGPHPQFYENNNSAQEPTLFLEDPVFEDDGQPQNEQQEVLPTPDADRVDGSNSGESYDPVGLNRLPVFESHQINTIPATQPTVNRVALTSYAEDLETSAVGVLPIAENPYRQAGQHTPANPLRTIDSNQQYPMVPESGINN